MANVDLRELAIDRGSTGLPRVHTRRHLLTRYVVPLVLIVGFLSLVAWASRELLFPPKPVTVMPVISTTAAIQEGTPLFNAAGWIEPRPTPVRVAALSPGVVEQLLVVEDQPVRAGETIAELVKDDAKLALDRALADLELRQAELDVATATLTAAETRFNQPVHLQATLGEAEASLAKVETQLKNLPFEIRRAESDFAIAQKVYEGKLAAKGAVAGVQIDVAKSKAQSAQAVVDELGVRSVSLKKEHAALTQRRDALNTQLELRADELRAKKEAEAQVRAAAAQVTQAKVATAEATLRLDRMTIRSPIDGRVFRLIAHPGARIGNSTTRSSEHDGSTVVTLYRPDMLQLRVDVRFEDIPKVSLNQPVEIDNPALSSSLTGKVLFISSEADIQKNTLQVKVEIPDPPPVFKPAMLVDVTFLSQESRVKSQEREAMEEGNQQKRQIFVPEKFVLNEGDTSYVWLADRLAGVASKQEIQVGNAGRNGMLEVTRGLNLASRIIATGTDGLTDGCRIRITGEEQSEP